MQDEQDVYIDINVVKLLDWLVSRRHCGRGWSDDVLVVRKKIAAAIQDMPASREITKLISGTQINYFHCVQIVEVLKDTESETRNIFGRYSSQRMKDWQEIVSLYQKDNIYLAEAAQMLMRNVGYEIPALKRRIVKLQQMHQECERKSLDCVKSGNDLKAKYKSSCNKLGLKGTNIKAELVELAKDLPNVLDKIVDRTKCLTESIQFYEAFAAYTLGKEEPVNLLPVLKYVVDKGNTTVYEWRLGKKPTAIDEPKLDFDTIVDDNTDVKLDSNEIDFGESDAIDFDDQIDFGGDEADATVTTETIDYGSCDGDNNQINFEITLEGSESTVAEGEDALSVLANDTTRGLFVNEIMELEAFLEQRQSEMGVDSDILSLNQFQMAPPIIQLQTADVVLGMIASVRHVLESINDNKTQQQFLIRASTSYVDRLVDSFKQKIVLSERLLRQRESLDEKRQQLFNEQITLQPKIDVIVQKTKELQKQVELDISKRYKNRPVNLIGGVNTL